MNDPDPDQLAHNYTPAEVALVHEDDTLLVANYTILESGWISLLGWQGSRKKVPPWRVSSVRMVETEPVYPDGERTEMAKCYRIADDHLREIAAGDAEIVQEAVADD